MSSDRSDAQSQDKRENDGEANTEQEETDDLRSRFPDVETDERLNVPRGSDLPEVPQAQFTRPAVPGQPKEGSSGYGRVGGISGKDLQAQGAAFTIGTTLVASIAVGTGLGWLIDRALGTRGTPWGLIIGFLLGTTAGFINLVRVASRLNRDE